MAVQIIIYTMFCAIGVVLGSFFTLATYRIPLKQDITHTRSYCPKCNSRLNFFDLIPVLSYIFLKGKCRYCHEKISPRYILIEIFSGIFYLLFVMSLKIDFLYLEINKIEALIYGTFIISIFFMMGGIAKESKKISYGVLGFGVIIQLMHIIYLYVFKYSIYRYIIYIFTFVIMFFINKKIKNEKNKNILNLLELMLFGFVATNEIITLVSIIMADIMILCLKKKNIYEYIFNFSFLNIIILIIFNFVVNYIIK